MKEIVKFEGLEITVEDGQVELTQHRNYSVNRVRIPLQLLDTVIAAIPNKVERYGILIQAQNAYTPHQILIANNTIHGFMDCGLKIFNKGQDISTFVTIKNNIFITF